MADQPPPNYDQSQAQTHQTYPPPQPQGGVVTQQPVGPRSLRDDTLLMQKLENIDKFHINQGKPWLEGLTLGVWPNSYIISDASRTVEIQGDPNGNRAPVPVFMVQEESNICIRCLCPGNQPFVARVHHAKPEVHHSPPCCGCPAPPRYIPDTNAGVAMTLEREGCCSRWLGCWVCSSFCQNDMFMHPGSASVSPGSTRPEQDTYFARSVIPIGGGGCTPTFELFVREGVRSKMGVDGEEKPFAWSQGPTFYGGWLSACFDTIFNISSEKGDRKNPDYVEIRKMRAETCGKWCIELCTKVDHYAINTKEKYKTLTPEEKMAILGNVIHIDYAFFENDPPPCYVQGDNNSAVIICTLCMWYCWGCSCPVQICIPLGGGDN